MGPESFIDNATSVFLLFRWEAVSNASNDTSPKVVMASYDSDSSFEDENFTETNVLLGYASKEPMGDEISQLGGHPVC